MLNFVHREGLVVTAAENQQELEDAERVLEGEMGEGDSGVIILSQDFAAEFLGPVPEEMLAKGISMQPSTEVSTEAGVDAFVEEYERIGSFLEQPGAADSGPAVTASPLVRGDADFGTPAI
jgi:hypothetical protein